MTKSGADSDGIAKNEADHLMKCPGCGQWFDMRDLAQQVAEHIHDAEIEISEGPGGQTAEGRGVTNAAKPAPPATKH
jgi:hypothetical protein